MSEDKKHPATPKRMAKAQVDGQIARSQDLKTVSMLIGVAAVVLYFSEVATLAVVNLTRHIFGDLQLAFSYTTLELLMHTISVSCFPAMLAAFFGAIIINYVELGEFQLQPLKFKIDQFLNPINGLQKMVSGDAILKLGMSFLKVVPMVVICYITLSAYVPRLLQTEFASLEELLLLGGEMLTKLCTRTVVFLLALGILDYLLQRFRTDKALRMSDEEVKEERKATDGNPETKKRIRSRALDLLKQRSVRRVPKADVVLVNPTHYAVAISYKSGKMRAPTVIAKGMDKGAERIRAIARKHGIPIVSQPPLTRLLYKRVRVGREIPGDLFQAVAAILAYVYRLRKRAA